MNYNVGPTAGIVHCRSRAPMEVEIKQEPSLNENVEINNECKYIL